MKLGLITDIHEQVDHLSVALDRFTSIGVDQVVVIGDVFGMGERIEETCRLLSEAGTIGVWGNHDYGLCFEPDAETRRTYSDAVLQFMTSLRPRLAIGPCHFSHIEPWLDATKLSDLWYFDGPPDEHGKLDRIFDAVSQRFIFVGHYHKWLLAKPEEITSWCGLNPIRLTNGRFFVVVGAVCMGHFAVFDTDTFELAPLTS